MQTITLKQLAEMLGMSVRGLRVWIKAGKMPTPVPGGARLRYKIDDVRELLAAGKLQRQKLGRPRKVKGAA